MKEMKIGKRRKKEERKEKLTLHHKMSDISNDCSFQ